MQCLFLVMLCVVGALSKISDLPPPCPSEIYCHGDLLKTVQMNSPYADSKTFVDMKMRFGVGETLLRFEQMMNSTGQNPGKHEIEIFLNNTFDPAGSEFEAWEPSDWKPKPKFLDEIVDPDLKDWGVQLNDLWKLLGRKIKDDVRVHPEQYSIIYVPNPVIVPGGRFREFYYWDSYWIVRGLLQSEMYNTVKGMLSNFLAIVDEFGFIPNGGRIYYSQRSQPPLLIPMMEAYYQQTKDLKFIRDNIGTLEKEIAFWMTNHTVDVDKDGKYYKLAVYGDRSSGPRPESFREDYETAHYFHTDEEREEYYSELKAAAESGWDFSTRWFVLDGTNQGNITNLKTRKIVPVDLNAFLFWDMQIVSDFYHLLGNEERSKFYKDKSETWLEAVTEVLWHEEVGVWLDYDLINEKKRDYFYPSNLAPLFTGCYDKKNEGDIVKGVMKYLQKTNVMVNLGGIPASLEHSGEQWDYPNSWPPLVYIMIYGLDRVDDTFAKELAYEIAERWIRANYKGFKETHAMFEKYDATIPGGYGGGGEYELQLGFGWTNGVIMDLLVKYGDRLTPQEVIGTHENASPPEHSVTPALVFLALVMASMAL
ncbi:trehalase isoform X2 [Neocloeon triangulifer]|nr:trehalase isoform X2 [Neocloeon triangulifer]